MTEKLTTARESLPIEPGDIFLTPQELAEWLKVPLSWIYEQTRARAKIRNRNPLPVIRLGKYARFSRAQVAKWMAGNGPNRFDTP